MKVTKSVLSFTLLSFFPLLIWEAASRLFASYLVPPPAAVLHVIANSGALYAADTALTACEAMLGLLMAMIISCLLAISLRLFPWAERYALPYAIALKSVPVVALAPLLVLAFGNGPLSKVVLAGLVCFFPLLVGTLDGLKSLPQEFGQLAEVWSASKLRRLFLMEFPFGAPYFASSLKVASPLAVVGAVVAEFSGADRGLGHAILVAAYRADVESLYAGILIASGVGIVFFALSASLERIILKRMGPADAAI